MASTTHHHRSQILLVKIPAAVPLQELLLFTCALLSVRLPRFFFHLYFHCFSFLPSSRPFRDISKHCFLLGYLIYGIFCLYIHSFSILHVLPKFLIFHISPKSLKVYVYVFFALHGYFSMLYKIKFLVFKRNSIWVPSWRSYPESR